jgi:hypothetical protein
MHKGSDKPKKGYLKVVLRQQKAVFTLAHIAGNDVLCRSTSA